jgi:GT2 family glycosyltransferase
LYGRLASPLALLHYGEAQELGARTAVGANLVVRRGVLDALGGFTPYLGRRFGTLLCGEDQDLCQRAVAAGYRCEYRPELRVWHWVPAARVRLVYYLRWFFWSGITNAVLERTPDGPSDATVPPYLVRRLLTAPFKVLRHAVVGQFAAAAAALVDASFAIGNITQRVKDRFGGSRVPSPGTPLAIPAVGSRRPR